MNSPTAHSLMYAIPEDQVSSTIDIENARQEFRYGNVARAKFLLKRAYDNLDEQKKVCEK